MFKFDFDFDSIDGVNNNEGITSHQANLKPSSSKGSLAWSGGETKPDGSSNECGEIKLEELIASLPPFLSYSSIKINTSPMDLIKSIWRRDLYDAKYQTYVDPEAQSDSSSEEEEEEEEEKKETKAHKSNQTPKEKANRNLKELIKSNEHVQSLLNAPSDLVPGIYEGGFKTWESSLDLIQYLSNHQNLDFFKKNQLMKNSSSNHEKKSFKVLEIGCGTALPTIWILFKLFYDLLVFEKSMTDDSEQNNQDDIISDEAQIEFHLQDFNPEVLYLLTFPNIILAFHRASQLVSHHNTNSTDPSLIEEDESGDIELTSDLRARFLHHLNRHHIHLRFFHGPWHSFLREPSSSPKYDLTYSSETIYSPHTLESLVDLFQRIKSSQLLVAAKSVYFGVGGSSFEFVKLVESRGGKVVTVWSTESDHPEGLGVGRLIMNVFWPIEN